MTLPFDAFNLNALKAAQQQQVITPPPPRLQTFTSDVYARPTTNHELFKGATPSPFFHEHEVRAPFTVGAQYRATDNTTVNAHIKQTPSMVNPTKWEREVIPATLNACAQVRNKNDVLRDKIVTATVQASMTERNVFHKSAEVLISKETPKGYETGVFFGVSRANGENTYRTGVNISTKLK